MAVEQRPMPTPPVQQPMPPMQPMPVPKPMPLPKPMPVPMPMPPMQGNVPCIPCDLNMLTHMYHHMKKCHRYEEKMMHRLMKMCQEHKYKKDYYSCESSSMRAMESSSSGMRRPDRYYGGRYESSSSSAYRRHRGGRYESSSYYRGDRYESSSHHRHGGRYESSSSAYQRPKSPCDC